MNKRFSVIIALCCLLMFSLFAGSAAEKKLLSLVPANAEGVLSIDLDAWLALPAVRKSLTESPDVSILKKRTGLVPSDLNGAVFWGSEGAWTLLVSTKKPFDPAKFFKAPEYICKKTTVDGKNLYTVTPPKVRPRKKGRKPRHTVVFVFHHRFKSGMCSKPPAVVHLRKSPALRGFVAEAPGLPRRFFI